MTTAFVDEVAIRVSGGRGGKGCCAFRREKFVPFGGPSGGDGGAGGSVILEASASLNTLSPLRHRGHYHADDGRPGEGSLRHGRSGGSLVIPVPIGTLIFDPDTGELLVDLASPGQRYTIAPGGRGGRGNARFASATNRAPRRTDPGEEGIDFWIRLELKLLADVGLVGLPNAGKSTLISRISAARPKIADYPFTTLIPNLGVVDWGDYRSYVVADIPGLIEGSHLGQGLGDQFLRHIQRTAVLLHLVDVSDMGDAPGEAIDTIEEELRAFDTTLLDRPRLLVATKLDAATDDSRLAVVRRIARTRGLELVEISSASGIGIEKLRVRAGELVDAVREEGHDPVVVGPTRPRAIRQHEEAE
jgi:GTP-binding protein